MYRLLALIPPALIDANFNSSWLNKGRRHKGEQGMYLNVECYEYVCIYILYRCNVYIYTLRIVFQITFVSVISEVSKCCRSLIAIGCRYHITWLLLLFDCWWCGIDLDCWRIHAAVAFYVQRVSFTRNKRGPWNWRLGLVAAEEKKRCRDKN